MKNIETVPQYTDEEIINIMTETFEETYERLMTATKENSNEMGN